jgi:hypothetical protein
MKRFVVLVLTAAVLLGGATSVLAQCQLPGFNALPATPPTPIYLGPQMAYYATYYPDVANAIIGGRDAWNAAADTAGRLGGYGGQTNSDCPLGQAGPQIGAYGFISGGCATAQAYGFNNPPPPNQIYLAFVDYFPWQCAGCGTKSLSLNLDDVAWATTPGVGQYDIQSVVAHELGHVLGFSHIWHSYFTGLDYCSDNLGPSCAQDSFHRNTMQANTPPGVGETCGRDLTPIDIANANYVY